MSHKFIISLEFDSLVKKQALEDWLLMGRDSLSSLLCTVDVEEFQKVLRDSQTNTILNYFSFNHTQRNQ